jgi:hypothetical protein
MMGNSFATVHPELVREWSERNAPLTADQVTYGSNKIVWWKGVCGHEWQASVKSRSSGEGCPICYGAQVISGINDLASLEPELAVEWSERNQPLTSDRINDKSRRNVWWRCECGRSWKGKINCPWRPSDLAQCLGRIVRQKRK